ncbi:hypothetical protein B0H14DRAFT_2712628 [Mycena olivaceomarginata]|nr:hypothetical protein B0H14DRAFT_2712628 [Mycena olivaceomarginata]
MSITVTKEMETLHRKFSRRLEKIRQEFDEDMMDLFLRFKTSAPKTKKQVASIPKISKPLVTKGSTNQKPVRPSARNGAHYNALRIPPIFEASEIENLRKPALEKLLADLGGPTNAKTTKTQRRAAAETHRLVEIDDDELANASDDYSPQAVTYGDEDDRMEEDEDDV